MTAAPTVPPAPHPLGGLPAHARLAALADAGTLAACAAAGASPHLARFGIAAQDDDGVVTAALAIGGERVLAAAQDERFLGGSVGARHAAALEHLFRRALVERPAAVVLLVCSGGVRLHEANAAEVALARALQALFDARVAGVPVLALAIGSVFGGASILACAAERVAMLPGARLGLSGPRVIEAVRGRAELDAADGQAVDALFGTAARAAAGLVERVDDDVRAVRKWVTLSIRAAQPFAADVLRTHAALAVGAGPPAAPPALPALLHELAARPIDAGRWLWRVGDATLTRPFSGIAFDGVSVHALDGALLDADAAGRLDRLVVTEDSTGHDVSRAAEVRFESRRLAHHAAVLAYLRARGVRETALLCGTGHSAAFFVNALQAPRLYALPAARVIAMEPGAVARVTGRDVAPLLEDDPLLGQPVRHLQAQGGVAGIVADVAAMLRE